MSSTLPNTRLAKFWPSGQDSPNLVTLSVIILKNKLCMIIIYEAKNNVSEATALRTVLQTLAPGLNNVEQNEVVGLNNVSTDYFRYFFKMGDDGVFRAHLGTILQNFFAIPSDATGIDQCILGQTFDQFTGDIFWR